VADSLLLAPPAVNRVDARPLLKWAGGKRQLLPALRAYYPERFSRYFEPFVGSGAVVFDLHASGRLAGRQVRLVDVNRDLIDCYEVLRDDTDAVIRELARLEQAHTRDGSACYYEVRDERFNPARAAGERRTPALAAMFIYLNRTGFNGLFRLNRRGGFNVPAGRYSDPTICDPEHLRQVATTLRVSRVSLVHGTFDTALEDAGAGDFVYCDPPYAPLSPTASFAHYTAGGFSELDQARLQRTVVAIAQRGACVVVSNSSAPLVERLYGARDARLAGLEIHRVPARRAINSRASARGVVDELVITNARRVELAFADPAATRVVSPRPSMLKATIKNAARKRAG
jgi:DNA adenine methylase